MTSPIRLIRWLDGPKTKLIRASALLALLLAAARESALAQSNLVIYSDSLASGWQDYSYGSTRNFANTSPVHSESDSILVTITNAWGALSLYHVPFTNSAYNTLSFWLNGGISGGQELQVYGTLTNTAQAGRFYLSTPVANTWQQYIVPLSALNVANATNFNGFAIQDSVGFPESTFYVDDIQLISAVPPPLVHVTVNAGQALRNADPRWYAMNGAQWDGWFDTPGSINSLNNMGTRAIRLPGGSNSDEYHWNFNRQDQNNWTWVTSLANFIHVITNINAIAMTTMNYGTGTTNEAAAWVAYVNASTTNTLSLGVDANGTNWHTAGYWASIRASAPLGTDDGMNFLRISRSAPIGFKYWEIGNEVYGSWETDSNNVPHDPYTYALGARDYISLIKAVDPTVKIGVVAVPGEDAYANNTLHPVVNPRTGQTHYGWTPVMLATLSSLGVTPDFLIHHRYPQNPGGEDDTGLLITSAGWAGDAGSLRQQLTDYMGSKGTNVELICTEHNSVSSDPGKQSVSLVNGLFLADSLAALMQTEFNGMFWWNFENQGTNTSGNYSPSLYGWRMYSDYGVLEQNNFFPPYYAERLMQHFVQPGDTILSASSDYTFLSSYAAWRQDGSVAILTINKNSTNTQNAQLTLSGYVPSSAGTIYSYGIPQDNAAEFGVGSPDVAQSSFSGAATTFNYSFAPYSATVMVLSPAAPSFMPGYTSPAPGQIVFQLQGQAGVPYVVQRSTNLVSWITVSTNIPSGSVLNITNSIDSSNPDQFWRAMWQP
jgi:alpha-N-arabinofuranosidase